jgi:hypothetical protein
MELNIALLFWTSLLAWISQGLLRVLYNVAFHPLRQYPGPLAARATTWWKTYIEVVKQESLVDVLFKLHEQYGAQGYFLLSFLVLTHLGEIVRIGPNEVSSPQQPC